jgi:hypothetical protein
MGTTLPSRSTSSAPRRHGRHRVRGLDKVTGTACLLALTCNILRFITVSA